MSKELWSLGGRGWEATMRICSHKWDEPNEIYGKIEVTGNEILESMMMECMVETG